METWYSGAKRSARIKWFLEHESGRIEQSGVVKSGFTVLGYSSLVTSKRGPKGRPRLWRPNNPFYVHGSWGVSPSWEICKFPYAWGYRWVFEGEISLFPLDDNDVTPQPTHALEASAIRDLWAQASEPLIPATLWLAEAMETVEGLKQPLNSLLKLSNRFVGVVSKRTKRLKGKDWYEAATGTWLEYSLAISPTVGVIGDQVKGLIDLMDPNRRANIKTFDVKRKQVYDHYRERKTAYILGAFEVSAQTEVTQSVIVKSGLTLNLRKQSRLQDAGFTSFSHSAAQLYETLPLSFAFDWCVALGPLLNSCRPLPGEILTSYSTVLANVERKVLNCSVGGVPINPGASRTIKRSITRRVDISPSGYLTWGSGLRSLSQGLTGAALAAGLIGNVWKKLPWH